MSQHPWGELHKSIHPKTSPEKAICNIIKKARSPALIAQISKESTTGNQETRCYVNALYHADKNGQRFLDYDQKTRRYSTTEKGYKYIERFEELEKLYTTIDWNTSWDTPEDDIQWWKYYKEQARIHSQQI
jgi:predicted transcriptional regulator